MIFLAFILCHRCTAEADEMPFSSPASPFNDKPLALVKSEALVRIQEMEQALYVICYKEPRNRTFRSRQRRRRNSE